jgi:integrase
VTEVKRLPHVIRRGNTLYYRRRVPVPLVAVLGISEIKQSLGTGDATAARLAVARLDLEWEQRFAAARKQVAAETVLRDWVSPEEARWVIEGAAADLLGTDEELRIEGLDEATAEVLADKYSDLFADLTDALPRGKVAVVARPVQERLSTLGVRMDPKGSTFRRLAYEYMKHQLRALEAISQRVHGKPVDSPAPVPLPESAQPAGSPKGQPTNGMLALVDKWARERRPTPQTADQVRSIVRDFERLVGTKAIREITADDVMKYKDLMLEAGDRAAKTIRKRLTAVKTLLRYAKANRLISSDPSDGITVAVPKGRARYPFTHEELETLFSVPAFSSTSPSQWLAPSGKPGTAPAVAGGAAAFWLPVMSLLSGARIEELAQLFASDIRKSAGGNWYMEITDEGEGQRLKTEASRRKVPLHPELVRLGLVDYAQSLPEGSHLFPLLKVDQKYGKRSKRWSEWFNEYLRSAAVGIQDKRRTLHSLRHTFKDLCRDSRVPKEIHDAITGHASGSVGDSYGIGHSVDTLFEYLSKVSVPVRLGLV